MRKRNQFDNLQLVNNSRLPVDFKAALITILDEHGDRPRRLTFPADSPLSTRTQYMRTVNVLAGFVELLDDGFDLKSPRDIEPKHFHHLVQLWVTKRQKPGTVENKLTYWRTFAQWTGNEQVVSALAAYIDRGTGYRRIYGDPVSARIAPAVSLVDLMHAVSAADGNKKAAARALGISNAALYRLFGMHGVRDDLVKPCVPADVSSVDLMNSLRAANGNKKGAARELGISRQALYRLLGKYGITDEPAGPLASR